MTIADDLLKSLKAQTNAKDCPMCGKPAKRLVGRWYVHDNQTQVLTWVCIPCADHHAKAVKR